MSRGDLASAPLGVQQLIAWTALVLSALAACGDSAPVAGTGTRRHVLIGHELTSCEEHADCRLVETACSSCCMTGAIAIDQKTEFDSTFEEACSDYHGGQCNCIPPDVVARCKDGECVTVARAEIKDCFSPTQHASSATAPDAVGCHCDIDMTDVRVCTDAGVLECVPTGTVEGPVWQSVEHASCDRKAP